MDVNAFAVLFDISAATNTILLDKQTRKGEAAFTVTNRSGRALRGRASLSSQDTLSGQWLTLAGDTERAFPIAAGTANINQGRMLRLDNRGMRAHRCGASRDLLDRFPFDPQGGEKAADLSGCRFAAHDFVHDCFGFGRAEVYAVDQFS
jgi:hypothetical protein